MTIIESLSLLLLTAILVLQLIIVLRARSENMAAPLAQLQSDVQLHQQQTGERIERELRAQVQQSAQGTRQELGGNFGQLQQAVTAQLETLRHAMTQQGQHGREEQAIGLKRFGDSLQQSL